MPPNSLSSVSLLGTVWLDLQLVLQLATTHSANFHRTDWLASVQRSLLVALCHLGPRGANNSFKPNPHQGIGLIQATEFSCQRYVHDMDINLFLSGDI